MGKRPSCFPEEGEDQSTSKDPGKSLLQTKHLIVRVLTKDLVNSPGRNGVDLRNELETVLHNWLRSHTVLTLGLVPEWELPSERSFKDIISEMWIFSADDEPWIWANDLESLSDGGKGSWRVLRLGCRLTVDVCQLHSELPLEEVATPLQPDNSDESEEGREVPLYRWWKLPHIDFVGVVSVQRTSCGPKLIASNCSGKNSI
jgi:hypothetical protein